MPIDSVTQAISILFALVLLTENGVTEECSRSSRFFLQKNIVGLLDSARRP